ncbi:MAG: outer membrane beta-barrel protein [Pseudomonadota bacterium]
MKKFAVALATTALVSGAALADAKKFDGPFIGAQIGIAQSDGKFEVQDRSVNSLNQVQGGDLSTKGVVGGIHLGWDKVFQNKWLLGLEVYGDLSSLNGKASLSQTNTAGFGGSNKVDMDWSIGVNVRGGVIISDTLAYLSLGWVGSDWEIRQTDNRPGSDNRNAKKDKFKSGFRVGLGMATMLNDNLMLGVEAAYSWYDDIKVSRTDADPIIADRETLISKYDPEVLEAKLKLSWKIRGIS